MILISFSLVVIAFALLLVGIFTSGLTLVYISIGVSVVSGALLLVGVLLRRGETQSPAPAAGGVSTPELTEPLPTATEGFEVVPAVPAAGSGRRVPSEPAFAADPTDEQDGFDPPELSGPGPAAASEGNVVVISGRPRYHTARCRFVAGRPEAEEIPVEEAREVGFTPCGVCRPDEALLGNLPGVLGDEPDPVEPGLLPVEPDLAAVEPDLAAVEPDLAAVEPDLPPVAPPTGRGRTRAATSELAEPAGSAGAGSRLRRAPSKAPAADTGQLTTPPLTGPPTAPPTVPPIKTARASGPRTSVVVIPDRPKFHLPACRFVRDSSGTLTLTRASAARQGYAPCGVCKP